jgi:hypothetical protein
MMRHDSIALSITPIRMHAESLVDKRGMESKITETSETDAQCHRERFDAVPSTLDCIQ